MFVIASTHMLAGALVSTRVRRPLGLTSRPRRSERPTVGTVDTVRDAAIVCARTYSIYGVMR
jgi:hypothetical protein